MEQHTTYIVEGSSGRWELFDRWVVAVFTEKSRAEEWCRRCSRYGDWIAKMAAEAFAEAGRESTKRFDADDSDNFQTQWDWAIEGSEDQHEAWRQEFEQQYPDGDWFAYWRRELSLMLNPYDPYCYDSRWAQEIRYRVVESVRDPAGPFGVE